ncbi:MAG: hypothetical protein AAGK04_13825 [Planctomycetota bacterium]
MASAHAPTATGTVAIEDAVCFGCGYRLVGLDPDGQCPECGFSVDRSLRGELLVNASPRYVTGVHRGVTTVFFGLVMSLLTNAAMIVFAVAVFIIAIAQAQGNQGGLPFSPALLQVLPTALGVLVALVMLFGWWLASAPDPGYTGRHDGSKARRWLRVSVCVLAVAQILNLLMTTVMSGGVMSFGFLGLSMLVGFVALMAWGVWFFASMQYVRWMAPRIPDPAIGRAAKRNMWLLPLLYIPGSIVLLLGPVAAMILYGVMVYKLRKRLSRVLEQQRASLA